MRGGSSIGDIRHYADGAKPAHGIRRPIRSRCRFAGCRRLLSRRWRAGRSHIRDRIPIASAARIVSVPDPAVPDNIEVIVATWRYRDPGTAGDSAIMKGLFSEPLIFEQATQSGLPLSLILTKPVRAQLFAQRIDVFLRDRGGARCNSNSCSVSAPSRIEQAPDGLKLLQRNISGRALRRLRDRIMQARESHRNDDPETASATVFSRSRDVWLCPRECL